MKEERNGILEHNFTYHPPKNNQPEQYKKIRDMALLLAKLIDAECPNCRERSLAFTNIEQAVMWANAAIARNG